MTATVSGGFPSGLPSAASARVSITAVGAPTGRAAVEIETDGNSYVTDSRHALPAPICEPSQRKG